MTNNKTAGKTAKTFCKACGKETEKGNEFCTPEEGREFYEQEEAEKTTEEFFKRRFPDKDIAFEKKCGYFYEWVARFKSGRPEDHMDNESMEVWQKMQWGED